MQPKRGVITENKFYWIEKMDKIVSVSEESEFVVKVEMSRNESPRFLKSPIDIKVDLCIPRSFIDKVFKTSKLCTISTKDNKNQGMISITKEDWKSL